MRFTLKIFKIDKNHHKCRGKNAKAIVNVIRENHKNGLYANEQDLNIAKPEMKYHEEGEMRFFTYCFNQPKAQTYWKHFLPEQLSQGQNFDVVEFSFVLFVIYNSDVYCTIGGSGFTVIKNFVDPYFGIDLYQHFADPEKDILLKVSTRGIAGNVSQKDNTYTYDQRISESLEYSDIPKKLKILVREELKRGIFKKYDLSIDNCILEVGSYFSLRKKLDFRELKELIIDIDLILADKGNYRQLTLLKKIADSSLIEDLDHQLRDRIVDDIGFHSLPNAFEKLNSGVIELTHPYKLEKFYECDKFLVRFKKTRSKTDRIVQTKNDLYFECTKHIYDNAKDLTDNYAIRGKLFELDIIGLVDEKKSTFGNFLSHVVCEQIREGKKYFRIDNNWYILDDRFLARINEDAVRLYREFELKKEILNEWASGVREDDYNETHISSKHFILDKVLYDNIELCDILYVDIDTVYFIHVKNGFTASMRNLYIQVVLAAKRLWNDLNNNTGSSYLLSVLDRYIEKKGSNNINPQDMLAKISDGNLKIEFVMAYNNNSYKGQSPLEKINSSDSNIAKYSLVQTVREMREFRSFSISVIDISKFSAKV